MGQLISTQAKQVVPPLQQKQQNSSQPTPRTPLPSPAAASDSTPSISPLATSHTKSDVKSTISPNPTPSPLPVGVQKEPESPEKSNNKSDKEGAISDASISLRDQGSAALKPDDGHYETLDGPIEDSHAPLESKTSPSAVSPESGKQQFKLPTDVKAKADPFSAQYDTLRMMPDVDWEKKKSKN